MKKARSNGYVHGFTVNYNCIDANGIINIYRYLLKETWYKVMFGKKNCRC